MIIQGTVIPSKYSKIQAYVSSHVPLFEKLYPKRYRIFEELCTDAKIAKSAVTWKEGPKLTVFTKELAPKLGFQPNYLGVFAKDLDPDRIWISENCAKKYQGNPEKFSIAMQYLLFHECLHWARHKAKAPSKAFSGQGLIWWWEDKSRFLEAGDTFEILAYGQDMSHTWK